MSVLVPHIRTSAYVSSFLLSWVVACNGSEGDPTDAGTEGFDTVEFETSPPSDLDPPDASTGGAPGSPTGGATGDPSDPELPQGDYCDPVIDWDAAVAAFEDDVVALVNERRSQGADCGGGGSFGAAPPLAHHPNLRCSARVHSLDMQQRGYFSHTNPDGESPFDRMNRAGYDYSAAGENIAQGQPTPADVVETWMNSSGHCANIMNPDFTDIGVGYVDSGRLWTQNFGAQGLGPRWLGTQHCRSGAADLLEMTVCRPPWAPRTSCRLMAGPTQVRR